MFVPKTLFEYYGTVEGRVTVMFRLPDPSIIEVLELVSQFVVAHKHASDIFDSSH